MEENINQQEQTLEQYILSKQTYWTNKIKEINDKFKTILSLQSVTQEVYGLRQDLEEYHKQVLFKCAALSRDYKRKYAEMYNAYKTNTQIRYSSDAAINAQIAGQLADYLYTMDLMNHHSDFINESIKNVDSIIYGIKHRIDIENLLKIGALK
jgi:hypothetical protein